MTMKNYTLLISEESKAVIKSLTDMSIVITKKSTDWKRVENKYKHLHTKKVVV
jgi:hypothetical protein